MKRALDLMTRCPSQGLPSRREWILTVTILVTDLSVWPMNHNFTLIPFRDSSRSGLGLTFCFVRSGNSAVTLSSNGPLAVMRHNMLVFTHDDK